MRGRSSCFWASVPCSMIAGAMFDSPRGFSVPGAWERCISSAKTTCSMIPAPRPPYSSGHAIAAYRASASSRFHARSVARRSASISMENPMPLPRYASVRCSSSQARNSLRNASASGG